MRRFCLFVTLYLFVFTVPTFALEVVPEGGEPFQLEILGTEEATSSPEEVPPVETPDSSELPQVRLTPLSPFYFLKTLWENVCWFIRRSPEERASLALELAEKRLAEALQVSEKKKFSSVERLFKEREALLNQAGKQLERLAGDEARREKIRKEILEQLALGSAALLKIKATLSGDDALRADNLSAWWDLEAAKLEEGLGPPQVEFFEATESVVLREATPEALLLDSSRTERGRVGGVSFFESIFHFLLGPRRALLSPLAAPEGD